MRLIPALAVAFSLFCAPVLADCPPLTPAEVARGAELAHAPESTNTQAIDVRGFKVFCPPGRHPNAPLLCTGGTGGKLSLTQVRLIDLSLRMQFQYRDDYIQYGPQSDDLWRAGVLCGDCEDYALTLADRLYAAGEGGPFMRLAIWFPSGVGAHATLLIETTDAGVVEAGVGPISTEGPLPYNPTRGRRFATIRFDGARKITTEPGIRIGRFGDVVYTAQP